MANLFTLMGTIMIENSKANSSISDTSSKGENLAKKFVNIATSAAKMGTAVATAVGAAAVAFTTKGVVAAQQFQKEMSNVGTLLDGDKASVTARMNELGETVKSVSKETGVSTGLLTDGLYQVISALGDSADSMEILETAAKGAKAGNAEVTDSVNLLSAVMKGYGDVSKEAASKASDLAFNTVKLGQTSFPELASSMGAVIPLASTLKVSQEELFTSYATLTGVTGSTAEVTTQLKATLSGMMSPTKDMSAAMKELGYESGDAMIAELGFEGSLLALKDQCDGNIMTLAKLFSSTEAQTGVMALAGSQADTYSQKLSQMGESAGATERAFATQTDNFASSLDSIKNKFDVLEITVGEKVLPVLQQGADWVNENWPLIEETVVGAIDSIINTAGKLRDTYDNCTTKLQEFDEWCQTHETTVQLLGVGITTLVVAMTAYNVAANAETIAIYALIAADNAHAAASAIATTATTAFGTAVAFLTSPITLTVAAIGALVAIGVILYKNWDTISEKAGQFKDKVVNKVSGMASSASAQIEKFKDNASAKFDSLKTKALNKVESLKSGAVSKIEGLRSSAVSKIEGMRSGVVKKFDAIKTGVTNKINGARDAVKNAINRIKGFFNFTWSLPKIKLPHLNITGKFSLDPPSTPKFSIQWYRKAMDFGMILDHPTIFGRAQDGTFLGGGEVLGHSETIVGTENLQSMIRDSVEKGMEKYNADGDKIDTVITLLQQILQAILQSGGGDSPDLQQFIDWINQKLGNKQVWDRRRV